MRKISLCLIALWLTGLLAVKAKDYYVAKDGDDAHSGTSEKPFKTIQKAADVMISGDVCFIGEGKYEEAIRPASNGVTFKAMAGARVEVTAYQKITNWQLHQGKIYVAQISWDLGDENQLIFNQQLMNLARWPNKTNFDPFDLEALAATGDNTSISHKDIPDLNWEEGGVLYFLGKNRWTSWRRPITGASAGVVNFNTLSDNWQYGGSHSPGNGGEFFLMNILEALDSNGEWYIDRAAQKVYFQAPGGVDPANAETLVRKRTSGFNLSDRTNITLECITVVGGNIDLKNANGCIVNNCQILYGNHTIASTSAAFVGQASIVLNDNSQNNTITHNNIQWGAANGVVLKGNNNLVDNNYIGNFNYLGSYATPVELRGKNDLTRNEIFNAGRDAIRGGGNGSDCGYNNIHHSNLINDDCGGIYLCCGSFGNTRLHHNWIHDITSRNENFNSYKATGIYLDNSTKEVIVDHNVMWKLEWTCIQINWEGTDLLMYNNTLWSNDGEDSRSMGRWVNGFDFFNVQLYNTLANEGEFHASDEQNSVVHDLQDNPFENFDHQIFVPKSGSPAIDAGKIISGYTNDYTGSAPDAGAYERGGVLWKAGPDWELGPPVAMTAIEVTPASLTLAPGELGYLVPVFSPANTTNKSVIWHSDDESIATVNASGILTAVAEGSTHISATNSDGSLTANAEVTVTPLVTGIDDGVNNGVVTIYPNPTSGLAKVNQNGKPFRNYLLLDMQGHIIEKGSLKQQQRLLDLGHLPGGTYLLVFSDKQRKIQRKVILR
ncbi:Ig-like domain-containing protein [Fulvivirgaceae bacterium BMA12]|uniref:Ig-like domain-containing protein n=1 Tax=Agaribacillus aureus TaxID=3051825 RepID=A0ABT8L1Z1_9BACT|nr:Ig-like domain-containing protein [Fulvivirgaceae bacterium BMA12]